MHKWISELAETGEPSVLVTVTSVRGSAPREVGAKMIVTAKESIGTIGGGQLEYLSTQIACEQLKACNSDTNSPTLRRFALGANCGQCCGGVVEVMFESVSNRQDSWLPVLKALHGARVAVVIATSTRDAGAKFLITAEGITASKSGTICPDTVLSAAYSMLHADDEATLVDDYLLEPIRPDAFNIAVFGAGHVGAATVDVMSRLDCNIRWIDSRRNIFPIALPQNVTAIESADPSREVLAMPGGSLFLIMTHSHPLDQEICAQVLRRRDFAYCGLIGSLSKRRRFERRLMKQGVPASLLDRLVCPVGVTGVQGKKPAEIAIAVAAEVLQARDSRMAKATNTGINEEYIRAI